MDTGSFQGQNSLFRSVLGFFWNFGVVGGSWHKRQVPLRSLRIFRGFLVNFWGIWSG
jgi:hypothetical protein